MTEPKTRLRSRVELLTYPTGDSLRMAQKAGGVSKLSDEEREKYVERRVVRGGWCDDVPKATQPAWIERGLIEVVSFVLSGLAMKEAVEHVEGAGAEELDVLEAEESGAKKPRKKVLAAIEARRATEGGA